MNINLYRPEYQFNYQPPLYLQLADMLIEQIESGQLKLHSKIPSERELSEKYGLSRMTAREAIKILEERGFVYRQVGKGTFVEESKIEHMLTKFVGFTDEMLQKGIKPGAKILKKETIIPSKRIRESLKLNLKDEVYYLQRVRYGNNNPLVVENSYFPKKICPELLEKDLISRSIYDIIRKDYHLNLVRAVQTLEPIATNEYESEILGVKMSSPALLITRISYDNNNVPIEFAKDIYRGDRSRFYIEMSV